MKKKIFAMLLTICMLIGLLPLQGFAGAEKEEITVAVTGKAMEGKTLKADVSELSDSSKAVIQWEKKKAKAKDSTAKEVGEGEKTLTLKSGDVGSVFRIVVKETKDAKKSYTSAWTKKVKANEGEESETGDPEIKESETAEAESETKTIESETKEPETGSTESETKESETEKPEIRSAEDETNESETNDAESETKKPEIKTTASEVKEAAESESETGTSTETEKESETETNTETEKESETETNKETEATTPETEKPVYTIELSKSTFSFKSGTIGYTSAPKAETIEVINSGNVAIKLNQPTAYNFTIGTLSATELAPGAKASFTIQPKTGLARGSYEDTVTVTTTQGTKAECKVTFHVTGNKLIRIVEPKAVTAPNGKAKLAKSLGLPGKVKIKTSEGYRKAKITWNVTKSKYNKSNTNKQTFQVTGKIKLPDGVVNPDKVSLKTKIQVTVKAYEPIVPDKASNQITSIEEGKNYNTNTDLTFQAVGAGMKNITPKKGDVRYRPGSWYITSNVNFTNEEFKGTFRISQAGSYTLKVTYARQVYDGEKWVSDGSTDEKSVNFKAAVGNTSGTSSTSSTSQSNSSVKTAAKTGDDTPILPLIAVSAICLLCIGIAVFSKMREKKKH